MNNQSENINELASSLAKAQGLMSNAKKDKNNPFYKSNYADLSSVWDACRDALSTNGLSVIQTTEENDHGKLYLRSMLVHSSGQWISGRMPLIVAKNDAQALGSSLTYTRRYMLAALVGIAASEDDDDGNNACDKHVIKDTYKKVEMPAISKEKHDYLIKCINGDKQLLDNINKRLHDNFKIFRLEDIPENIYPKVLNVIIQHNQEKQKTVA